MTRADAIAMYETEVRTRLGRPLTEEDVELMRDLYEDDVTSDDCALRIENANEAAYDRAQEGREPRGRYSRQEFEDITNAGRGHLLRID